MLMVNKKKLFFFMILGFAEFCVFSQVPSQIEQIRIQVWAELDSYPGKFEDFESQQNFNQQGNENFYGSSEENVRENLDENLTEISENYQNQKNQSEFEQIFSYAINRTKELSPFLLSGMIYGFNFEYTPSDKRRNVSEYWDFTLIKEISKNTNEFEYKNPMAEDNKLICWVYCTRTQEQIAEYKHWMSVVYPKVKGIGKASVENGFEGIKEACSQAAKLAVREYWRTMIKNKPKEISGKLLLVENPRIYIKNGEYVVDLDFFMETDKIISYTYY